MILLIIFLFFTLWVQKDWSILIPLTLLMAITFLGPIIIESGTFLAGIAAGLWFGAVAASAATTIISVGFIFGLVAAFAITLLAVAVLLVLGFRKQARVERDMLSSLEP